VVYPTSTDATVIASGTVEKAATILREYKDKIKQLKEEAESLEVAVKQYMGTRGSLMSVDGRTLATWRNSKGSMSFNETLFKQEMTDIYEKIVTETPGSRRFLLK